MADGIHTATIADIDGRRYVFAARNPEDPALLIYDITDPASIALGAAVPIPPAYGIHDTYVRDGLAFVFAWNTGVIIYDVGNGILGGSPSQPVEVSRLLTADDGVAGGASVHNGWWFHNPVRGENRYLFIGQEGAGVIGEQSSGDMHVVDVFDLRAPEGGRALPPGRRRHPQLLGGRVAPDPLHGLLQRRRRCPGRVRSH